MNRIFAHIISIVLVVAISPAPGQNQASEEGGYTSVFVVQQAWHTGIIVKTEDINEDIWPEISRYTSEKYVDISWGDEKFYQAEGRPVWLAARAVLFPTQSVLRVFSFDLPLKSSYGQEARIIEIQVNDEQFKALTRFISESYKRDGAGNPQPSTIYGESRHYFLATRKYHLFRTCNTWVALAFKKAGFDIRSCCVLNANQLFRQLENSKQ
ncbi:MAG: DUF2459 domain-containing protein [Bacteroidota bacterium]